jgi:hypothetical protein
VRYICKDQDNVQECIDEKAQSNAAKGFAVQTTIRPFPTYMKQRIKATNPANAFGMIGGGVPLITGFAAAIILVWKQLANIYPAAETPAVKFDSTEKSLE